MMKYQNKIWMILMPVIMAGMVIFGMWLGILLSSGTFSPARADSAVTCHCFRDRSFDPGRKFSADDYIRASSFNALLAVHFSIPKRMIVMAKMNGLSEDDLVASLHLSARTGRAREAWLDEKEKAGNWVGIFRRAGVALPAASVDDRSLVDGISTALVASHFDVPASQVGRLLDSGLDLRGALLALTLADVTGRKAGAFAYDVLNRKQSWGEIFQRQGRTPEAVAPLIEGQKK